MNIPPKIKEQIETLIAKNQLEQALNLLEKYSKNKASIIQVKRQLSEINHKDLIGIVDSNEVNRKKNQITNTILSLLDPDTITASFISQPEEEKSNHFWQITGFILVICSLYALFEIARIYIITEYGTITGGIICLVIFIPAIWLLFQILDLFK